MGCSCTKKEFILKINTAERRLLGLDECVLGTLISFPVDEDDIAEMMWEQVNLYNDLSADEKDIFKPALLEFYLKHKDEYSLIDNNCAGCSGCE